MYPNKTGDLFYIFFDICTYVREICVHYFVYKIYDLKVKSIVSIALILVKDLSISLSLYLSTICLSIYLFIYISICVHARIYIYLSIYMHARTHARARRHILRGPADAPPNPCLKN